MNRFNLTGGEQSAKTREILVYFMAPRYTTTERDAINEPKQGQIIYNTTTNKLNFYTGTAWEAVTSS